MRRVIEDLIEKRKDRQEKLKASLDDLANMGVSNNTIAGLGDGHDRSQVLSG